MRRFSLARNLFLGNVLKLGPVRVPDRKFPGISIRMASYLGRSKDRFLLLFTLVSYSGNGHTEFPCVSLGRESSIESSARVISFRGHENAALPASASFINFCFHLYELLTFHPLQRT